MGYYLSKMIDHRLNELKNKILDRVLNYKNSIPIGVSTTFDPSVIPENVLRLAGGIKFPVGSKIEAMVVDITGQHGLGSFHDKVQFGIDITKVNTMEREVSMFMTLGEVNINLMFTEIITKDGKDVRSEPIRLNIPIKEINFKLTVRFVFDFDDQKGENGSVCLRINEIQFRNTYGGPSPTFHMDFQNARITGNKENWVVKVVNFIMKMDKKDKPGKWVSALLGGLGVWNLIEDVALDKINEMLSTQKIPVGDVEYPVSISIECGRIKQQMYRTDRIDNNKRKKMQIIHQAECEERKKRNPDIKCEVGMYYDPRGEGIAKTSDHPTMRIVRTFQGLFSHLNNLF